MTPRATQTSGSTSALGGQRGYILSSVVVLSIVIFSSILIVLQYVSAVHGSIRSTIRIDTARQIANEQMRTALTCAEEADSPASCVKTNHSTGTLNGKSTTTNVSFTPSASSVDITATTTVGASTGLHDSFTVKAQAPIKSSAIQTVELPETPADDSEWVMKLTAGSNHTCALTNEKRLYCWGDNAQGQIGTGNSTAQTTPYLVGLTGVDDVDAGMNHTCAIANPNRTVYCWGWNGHGQLGLGNTIAVNLPQATSPAITNATSVSTANSHTCAINTSNQLRCWGRNDTYQIGTGSKTTYVASPYLVTNSLLNNQAAKVSAGHAHTCVIRTDNRAYCWGLSEQGAVTGYYVGSAINPVQQDGGRSYREIKAGHWHTCGIDTTSRVRCWGYNHNGQTGKSRPWTNIWGPDFINSPPNTATTIDSFAHNCAVADGGVYCWGNPGGYRLGNGGSNVWTPYKVPGLNQASAVTTGDRHSCAAVNSGRQVRCWGDNSQGQFGSPDASKTPSSYPTPASLNLNPGSGSGSFQSDNVTAGTYAQHTCALQSRNAYCWGNNSSGQLGDGSKNISQVPIKGALEDQSVLEVGTGLTHTCALIIDGGVKCWGSNEYGQMGNGTTSTTGQLNPVSVSLGGAKAQQLAVGTNHTCALLSNESVRCWGANSYGVNGNGLVSGSQTTPSTVPLGGLKAKFIAAGSTTTCAILEDSSLRCWGSNSEGQMGNGTTGEYQLTPVSPNLGNLSVRSVSVGYATTCAILEDSSLRCWGFNIMGNVGNGNKNPVTTPVAVNLGGQKARQVSAGMYHTCAVLENNEARCWGFNSYGTLGNGTTTEALTPTPTSLGSQPVKQITASSSHSCASMLNSSTRCWGMGYIGNPAYSSGSATPVPVVNAPKPIPSIVSAGNQHSCAIDNKEKILCWGGNSAAELGDGTRTGPRTTPITVDTGGRKAMEVSAGDQHTCAVLKDGAVLCWGFNSSGQIGQGNTTTTHYTSPATVNLGGKKATQVSVSGATTCAVLVDGELKCWGWNSNGQVGDGTITNRPSPVTINLGGVRAVQVSVGAWHTCVVLESGNSNGNAKCWGHNGNGKLGINSTTDQRSPVDVRLNGRRATQISASQYHTCAVMEEGDAMCWGFGGDGRLGTGSTTQRLSPFAVSLGGRKVSNISTGAEHTCAAFKDKSTHCWGKGASNQLGYGNTTSYQIPMPVGHPGSSNTSYVSAGWTHSCAAISSQVRCWGGNATYQLGSGTTTAQVFPMAAYIERTRYEEARVY